MKTMKVINVFCFIYWLVIGIGSFFGIAQSNVTTGLGFIIASFFFLGNVINLKN